VNIVREKNYEVGHVGFGGDYGPHEFVSGGYRLRFFITQYSEKEVALPHELTRFHLRTNIKIEKRFLNAKVVDFTWEAPDSANAITRIEEEIFQRLNNDSSLRSILLDELNKEGNVTIKSYTPKKTSKQTGADVSYAQIVLHGELRKKKDIYISRRCFDMYNQIAGHILQVKTSL
jgi:hypothetical protein